MTETSYASQFLQLLSTRACKYNSSYCDDAKTYPAGYLYTLPKVQPALEKRTKAPKDAAAATEGPIVSITFKPRRPHPSLPPTTLTFPISTPISTVRSQLAQQGNFYPEKLQLLLKAKILKDATTLSELTGENGGELAIMVNIQEGAEKKAEEPKPESSPERDAVGGQKRKVDDEAFWGELGEWLGKKVGEDEARKRLAVFRSAWEKESL